MHQTPQIRAIIETIKKFEEIKQWFLKQKSYHFYSSSLIVIYDGLLQDSLNELQSNDLNTSSNTTADQSFNNLNNNNSLNLVRVIMADFAHVFPANNQLDMNYLYGLERLIEHLNLLIKPGYKFKDIRTK